MILTPDSPVIPARSLSIALILSAALLVAASAAAHAQVLANGATSTELRSTSRAIGSGDTPVTGRFSKSNSINSQQPDPKTLTRALARLKLSNRSRANLLTRFEQFIRFEKTQSYDRQYELLAKTHLANLLRMNPTKENYVRFKQASENTVGKLVGLRVVGIRRTPHAPTSLTFSVTSKLQKESFAYFDKPIVVADLVNGNWYFSLEYID